VQSAATAFLLQKQLQSKTQASNVIDNVETTAQVREHTFKLMNEPPSIVS
jgi:hypothetical protein